MGGYPLHPERRPRGEFVGDLRETTQRQKERSGRRTRVLPLRSFRVSQRSSLLLSGLHERILSGRLHRDQPLRLGASVEPERAHKLPQLVGAYLYADYVSGEIWALRYDEKGERVIANHSIPSQKLPLMSFGEDQDGEVYFTTTFGTLNQFVPKGQ